jgi:hypothetical protein
MSDLSLNEAFRVIADKPKSAKPDPAVACDKAEKTLLKSLWKLAPDAAGVRADALITQLQDFLNKAQTEHERRAA